MDPAKCISQEKIEAIAKETYGADSVEYLPQAEKQIELYTKMGFAGLPICMAKTQYSFSADAAAKVPLQPHKPASHHHAAASASHHQLQKGCRGLCQSGRQAATIQLILLDKVLVT